MALPKIDLPHYTFTLPSTGETITFRPFTVKERKILLLALEAKDEASMMIAVRQIAGNCVQGDVDVNKFAPFDMEYFFLQLKARSISEETNLNYVCRNKVTINTTPYTDGTTVLATQIECGAPIKIVYNILTTKVIRNPEHNKKIPLENGMGIVMKYPSVSSQSLLDEGDGSATDKAFGLIAECVDYIWEGEKLHYSKDSTKEEMVQFLESLPDKDFAKIEKFFDTMPYVQDKLEFDCGKCGYHHTVTLEGLASFFD